MGDDTNGMIVSEVSKLVQKLIRKDAYLGAGDDSYKHRRRSSKYKDSVDAYVQYALRLVSHRPSESLDPIKIEEEIRARLKEVGRDADALRFKDLKRKLRESSYFRHTTELLFFLHQMANYTQQPSAARPGWTGSMLQLSMGGPGAGGDESLRYTSASNTHQESTAPGGLESSKSSGISSLHSSAAASGRWSQQQEAVGKFGERSSSARPFSRTSVLSPVQGDSRGLSARAGSVSSHLTGAGLGARDTTGSSSSRSDLTPRGPPSARLPNTRPDLPDMELLRELMSSLLGIEGQIVRFDSRANCYVVNEKVGVAGPIRRLASRVAECGWLYRRIRHYTDARKSERTFGTVGQSFCSALHAQLTEYYRLLASLEAQMLQEEDKMDVISGDLSALTIRRLALWTMDPLFRLKWIASLVDVCDGKKGGALASECFSYMSHGAPDIRKVVTDFMCHVAAPIYATVCQWMYEGELEDPYQEFFVAANPAVAEDRLWHEKYSLRRAMIPSFVSYDQAKKILLTGKSISFLRHMCKERASVKEREVVKKTLLTQVESVFTQDLDPSFERMVNTAYRETSQHLLETLYTKYQFLEHLKAMRRYLLLGQGDFIRHLMDLLETDLAKPATTLYLHNLSGILETAIRATNAQYDEPEILKRLDVRMLEVSSGDTGWDVFSLDYHVDGPISTVFTPDAIALYLRAFNFLWRAKRMEFILSGIWKRQLTHARLLAAVPEMAPLLHRCQILGAEMGHFVQQVQYYINFEVLECSWVELLERVHKSEDLDQVIVAHQHFLASIISRCLLHEKSREMLSQLRAIFDLIISYQELQADTFEKAREELEFRRQYDQRLAAASSRGQWATDSGREGEERSRKRRFADKSVPTYQTKFRILAASYQDMLAKFLSMLASHPDQSLRFLSVRLNFNQHYQDRAPGASPSSAAAGARPVAPARKRSSSRSRAAKAAKQQS